MNIDYNAVIEILKSFLENEKAEILGISVGEERQVREAIKNLLTAYEKEKEKNKELESDIQQKNFEIKCLNSDIKNMYCEEAVISILEDKFDLSKDEAIQILEE